jgi:hypothetical protein
MGRRPQDCMARLSQEFLHLAFQHVQHVLFQPGHKSNLQFWQSATPGGFSSVSPLLYPDGKELIPGDMPYSRGKAMSTSCFVNADHAGCHAGCQVT